MAGSSRRCSRPYCGTEWRLFLDTLQDELRFAFIVSYARIHDLSAATVDSIETAMPGLRLKVTPSAHDKCIRCWHHRADVVAMPNIRRFAHVV